MSKLQKLAGLSRVMVMGAAVAVASPAMANQKLCVFDVLGAQGDVFSMMKDYQVAAGSMGAKLELKAYTDEKIAAEDFKAGQCDAVMLMGLRARQFNTFTGSIEALGALPSYSALQKVASTLSSPAAAKLMVNGQYEVAGILPMGAAYLFTRDRNINSVAKLSGKKIAILDYDKAQAKMVQKIGAQPVASDVTNFAGKFNNGSVDVVGAPAAAFKPLELYKGLGTNGAIANYPVVQLTYQLVIRKDKFPADFGQKSRTYAQTQFGRALGLITKAEKEIDKKYWMDIPAADKEKYTIMLRESRVALTAEGIYDKKMMSMLKKVRCQLDAADAECAQNLE